MTPSRLCQYQHQFPVYTSQAMARPVPALHSPAAAQYSRVPRSESSRSLHTCGGYQVHPESQPAGMYLVAVARDEFPPRHEAWM